MKSNKNPGMGKRQPTRIEQLLGELAVALRRTRNAIAAVQEEQGAPDDPVDPCYGADAVTWDFLMPALIAWEYFAQMAEQELHSFFNTDEALVEAGLEKPLLLRFAEEDPEEFERMLEEIAPAFQEAPKRRPSARNRPARCRRSVPNRIR